MKKWIPTYIQQAEILQLILLARLYSRKESEKLFFQGGTAIRWCYGGSRFSEDLDFETHLSPDVIRTLLARIKPAVKRDLVAHLGPGAFELQSSDSSSPLCKIWVKFSPEKMRGKIAVKLEFQPALQGVQPETQPVILGALPTVAERIQNGQLRTESNTVLVVETLPEIMAGKVRALFERDAYKGRDFWDIWFLSSTLGVPVDAALLARKLRMYAFTRRRTREDIAGDLARQSQAVRAAIRDDLQRFIPPRTFAALEQVEFEPLLSAAREIISQVSDDLFD